VTQCPYKGRTSSYWSIEMNGATHQDLAWAYDFPARQLLLIAGSLAFYNEQVDMFIEGEPVQRPKTHFLTERSWNAVGCRGQAKTGSRDSSMQKSSAWSRVMVLAAPSSGPRHCA